ncbi:MAG TPA: DUF1223 domain-containing protein [Verrucomicrobiae bacterium]|jgi:hypothetical protein|nr:DUF1223 domain-containing protein [Verrucomicrobiae bacterium]
MEKLMRVMLLALAVAAVPLVAVAQNPVVVELFTSEGCSSCPPADAVLLQLSQSGLKGEEVILLGEHVDYWNYIGWTDRFSSKQFSQRQSEYASALRAEVYTPQMVIDGREQFVGNDAAEVASRIVAAAKRPMPGQVSLAWEGDRRLRVAVQSAPAVKAKVLLAITEDGLSTQVANGENGGKTLHHAAVVRSLQEIGELRDGKFESIVDVPVAAGWNRNQLKAIVLLQEPKTMKIVGAGQVRFPQ